MTKDSPILPSGDQVLCHVQLLPSSYLYTGSGFASPAIVVDAPLPEASVKDTVYEPPFALVLVKVSVNCPAELVAFAPVVPPERPPKLVTLTPLVMGLPLRLQVKVTAVAVLYASVFGLAESAYVEALTLNDTVEVPPMKKARPVKKLPTFIG